MDIALNLMVAYALSVSESVTPNFSIGKFTAAKKTRKRTLLIVYE